MLINYFVKGFVKVVGYLMFEIYSWNEKSFGWGLGNLLKIISAPRGIF
jgi:hypothetical protein